MNLVISMFLEQVRLALIACMDVIYVVMRERKDLWFFQIEKFVLAFSYAKTIFLSVNMLKGAIS